MKNANTISIRVFSKHEENEQQILEGLKKIINYNEAELKKEKLEIKKTTAKGFEEKITIFEFYAEKDRHTNHIIQNLNNKLSQQDKDSLKNQENRLDENLDFFLRLSKPLIFENLFELTDSGDCYHIKINIACFPKNLENAKIKIREIFK